MLEGPYHRNRWQERWLSIAAFFEVLQILGLLALAAVYGYEWFMAGQYIKLLAVFGSGTVIIALTVATKRPLFMIGLVFPLWLESYWP